jgi:CO/xanthine dehydrogenase Mo-binding subunit
MMDYALPYSTHMPPVDSFYQEVRAKTNPLGLRGLGECGNPGLGAAIAIAASEALSGIHAGLSVLPVTPSTVKACPPLGPAIVR